MGLGVGDWEPPSNFDGESKCAKIPKSCYGGGGGGRWGLGTNFQV